MEEMEQLSVVLKKPKDKRGEGQILANYDRVFRMVDSKAEEYRIEKPPLLGNAEGVDRKALVYFNTNQEVNTS